MKNSRYADYIPVALVLVGFALIGLGYNGAASIDYIQGQFPYMLSGGLIGLGLIFFGSAAFLLQAIKKGQGKQLEQLLAINYSMQRLSTAMSLGSNGSGSSTTNGQLVIVGTASFHLPSCKLVGAANAIEKVPRQEAEEAGLEACRVCNP